MDEWAGLLRWRHRSSLKISRAAGRTQKTAVRRDERLNWSSNSRLTLSSCEIKVKTEEQLKTKSKTSHKCCYFPLSMMRDSVFNCCVSPPHPPGAAAAERRSRSPALQNHSRFLMFFDFDETLVDECSDDSMVSAAPAGVLPGWLKDTYRPGRYNEYMQRVLAYLSEQGVTPAAIRATVEKLPPCPGIPALMHFLLSQPARDFEVVCVSDANTVFIETWLQHMGFQPLFLRIFTNPAHFDENGVLQLRPFHSHECLRCPANMCKAVVVRQYVAQRIRERGGRPYQKVLYMGDGANDFCPSLTLSPGDVAFPRRDFPMHKLIQEMGEAKPGEFKASVVPWKTGEDVINTLRKILERT